MKQQINFRASDLTRRQLDELGRRWGMNQGEVISVIIDRAYREEKRDIEQILPGPNRPVDRLPEIAQGLVQAGGD